MMILRKIKSERNVKKLKNSVNDFYYSWINHPAIVERLQGLSNKKINSMSDKLKIVVDRLYLELRVEEKYMYYTNLYNIYELICIYFTRKNKIIESLEKITGDKCVSDRIQDKNNLDVIQNYLGYETAFNNFIYRKADDSLHWLYSSLNEILKHYIGRIKDDNVTVLSREMERIIKNNEHIYQRKEYLIRHEITYLDEVLKRIKYARENVNIIYTLGHTEQDKKLRTMTKSSLTRTEKLIQLVIDEIEGAYAA